MPGVIFLLLLRLVILWSPTESHVCIKAAAAGESWLEDGQGHVCGRGEVWGQSGAEVANLSLIHI